MPAQPAPARVPDPSGRLPAPARPAGEPAADLRPEARKDGPAEVLIRYWAGARAAAGVSEERAPAGRLGAVLAAARDRHTGLAGVLALCAVLVDGIPAAEDAEIPPGAVIEILPPFAGG